MTKTACPTSICRLKDLGRNNNCSKFFEVMERECVRHIDYKSRVIQVALPRRLMHLRQTIMGRTFFTIDCSLTLDDVESERRVIRGGAAV